jgi:outer membrane protein OmpA-like peptidoglycan-associated protein
MLRAAFYITLLGSLLVAAFYLPKLVQNRDEFKPLSEAMSSDVAAPKPAPAAPEAPPVIASTPEPEPLPAPVAPEPAADLGPFVTAVASGDLAKAAAILDLLRPKLDTAKYDELSKSVEVARARDAAKTAPAPAPTEQADKALAATQSMVVESLKQLQQTQAETSKLLADLKARPAPVAPAPVAPAPAPAAPVLASRDPLPGTVVIKFGHDSSLLEQGEIDKLAPVLKALAADKAVKVELRGFADKKGNATYNLGLSNARAQSVKDVLRRSGIEDARMQIVPFGSFQAGSAGAEGADDFRKVEVLVIR